MSHRRQQLSYNAAGQLANWQNQPTSPTSTVSYLYDGSGQRVAMKSTVNGTVTTTAYIGSIEEVQTTGGTTQTTTYYTVGGKRVAASVNGTFYYFGYDALGSQVAVLNATGSVIGSQLYGPYGSSRYSNGTLPTSIGFTGQRYDSVTGLNYYNARYYDPTVGVFVSADIVEGNAQGRDPYMYVGGDPETKTDPTGRCALCVAIADGVMAGAETGVEAGSVGGPPGWLVGAVVGGLIGAIVAAIIANTTHSGGPAVHHAASAAKEAVAIGPHVWNPAEQENVAIGLKKQQEAARTKAAAAYKNGTWKGSREDPRKATTAVGLLTIWDANGNLLFNDTDVAWGDRGAEGKDHAESQLVEWAVGVIHGLGSKMHGALINFMIYSGTPLCAEYCQGMALGHVWLNQLYNAAGAENSPVTVSMFVFVRTDSNLPQFVYGGFKDMSSGDDISDD